MCLFFLFCNETLWLNLKILLVFPKFKIVPLVKRVLSFRGSQDSHILLPNCFRDSSFSCYVVSGGRWLKILVDRKNHRQRQSSRIHCVISKGLGGTVYACKYCSDFPVLIS